MLDIGLKFYSVPSFPLSHLLTDLEVKVTEFFLMYEISISHQSVIRKHSSFRWVCFHSVTTDPRIHAMGWGWRSKYRTSLYSSDFEFIVFLLQMHFNFIVKVQFRRAILFCDSSYYCMYLVNWTASSEFGTYRLCEQRRFRRACASAQSCQNLRCSLIQAVSQEEPSDRKPDPWPL